MQEKTKSPTLASFFYKPPKYLSLFSLEHWRAMTSSHWRTHSTESVTSTTRTWTITRTVITTTCHLTSKQVEAIDDVKHSIAVD